MSDQIVYQKTARQGRENQLFAENGSRLVAGCVVLNGARDKVLLISSSANPSKWVIPKGGVESDEPDYKTTAIRETWEEAGVTGTVIGDLGVVEDLRPPKNWGKMTNEKVLRHPPRSQFHFYEMVVEKEFDVYPESDERNRAWFSFTEAIGFMNDNKRPELAVAIERSSLKR